ncbi:MAG: DNA gyrase inhibitor YacG [Chloracidobacterium sp.]|nr:DNA gyrase inhibitor YacG [Chloracidobacterium sp.]
MPVVRCPQCGTETEFQGNEHRPFCSERCKLLDFGAWADEQYTMPGESSGITGVEMEEMEPDLR